MLKKKKIAFIYTSMAIGGVEKCLINMLRIFDYTSYDVTVWLLREEGELIKDIPKEVNIRCWGNTNPKLEMIKHYKHKNFFKLLRDAILELLVQLFKNNYCISNKYMCKMMPMVDDENYDCFVIYHGWDYRAMYNALYRFRAKKYILWLHCEPWLPVKYFRPYINRFDKVFCVSNRIMEIAKNSFPNYKNKDSIEVLYNISNIQEICAKANEECEELKGFSIVTVGRFGVEKGQEMVPEITRKLLDCGFDVYWYLVGDGSERNIIENNIQRFNVSNNVILLGEKYNPYPYMKKCDLYVQPSYTEGYCTTTVEAKVLEKPILVTDVPGMREQFKHMFNGYIVDNATVESILDGIKVLLLNPMYRDMFVENIKKSAQDRDSEIAKLYRCLEK